MKETILSRISGWIDENSAILADANNAIWEFAETAFNEKCSSAYLKQVLEQYGFRILPGAAGVPTRWTDFLRIDARSAVPFATVLPVTPAVIARWALPCWVRHCRSKP